MPQQPQSGVPTGWEVVEASAPEQATSAPKSSIPDGWEVVEESAPERSSGAGALAAGGALATMAGAVPVVKGLAERIATSPMISRGMAMANKAAAPLNVGMEAYNVLTGQKSPTQALGGALKGELMRRGANLAYRGAAPVATALGAEGVAGMAAPAAVPLAGGLLGTAGSAAFLGALQHDANRQVDIDYSKNTPDTWIARALGGGPSVDQRMDDPNDPMFRPDDEAIVRASVLAQLGGRR